MCGIYYTVHWVTEYCHLQLTFPNDKYKIGDNNMKRYGVLGRGVQGKIKVKMQSVPNQDSYSYIKHMGNQLRLFCNYKGLARTSPGSASVREFQSSLPECLLPLSSCGLLQL